MAVRLIPCRHTTTGAEADIPETALRYGHMPTYEPIEEADRDCIAQAQEADRAAAEAADADKTPTSPPPAPATGTTPSKPATRAAKNTKESRDGD